MFIMTYAYTGVLTAVLAVPKLEPTVDTLEALVEGNQLKVTKEGNCVMYEQIMVYRLFFMLLQEQITDGLDVLVQECDIRTLCSHQRIFRTRSIPYY